MNSIRTTLVAMLVAVFFLVSFLAALNGYRSSMEEAERLLDTQLAFANSALRASQLAAGRVIEQDDSRNFVFQVWQDEVLVLRSSGAPEQPLTPIRPGYRYSNFSGYRWRTLVSIDERGTAFVVAERADERDRLAENVVLNSVLPLLFWLPLSALLTWVVVTWGLRPLKEFIAQLNQKRSDDLSAVVLENSPAELKPLLMSTNALLKRLAAAFEREQHFAAHAAHELRTPLSVIKLHLQNLEAELPVNHPGLSHATQGVLRMQHLVEQILLLAQTNPEMVATQLKPLDLHDLAQRVLAESFPHFEARRQQLSLEGDSALVAGDASMLEVLLSNLLDNASKYSPEGSNVVVTVRSVGDRVQLIVSDNGPGITAEDRSRVFERFFRAGQSNAGGSGLGLAIVGHIVSIHGGRIQLDDGPDRCGLSVIVDFPRGVRH